MASTASGIDFDFATNSLVPSTNTVASTMLMDPAESMASLMAMQHHYHQQQQQQQNQQHQLHHFGVNGQYPINMSTPSFGSIHTSSIAAAAVASSASSSITSCLPSPFSISLPSTSASAAAAAVAAAASAASGCQVIVPMSLTHQNNGSNVLSTTSSQLISRYPIMGNHITGN